MPAISETFRLTSGDLQAVIDQAVADADRIRAQRVADAMRASVEAELRAWRKRDRPDRLDRMWSRWQDWERFVSSNPYPRKQTRGWARGVGRTTRVSNGFQTDTPDNHRSERFEW